MTPSLRQVFASPHLVGLHGLALAARTLDDCGAAAVATAMLYMGCQSNEGQAADALGRAGGAGIEPETIMRYVSGRGIRCGGFTGTPFGPIAARVKQAAVTLLLWPDREGHWVIPAGYDSASGYMVMADPGGARSRFWHAPLAEIEGIWLHGGRADSPRRQTALLLDRVGTNCRSSKRPDRRTDFRLVPWNVKVSTNVLREEMGQALGVH
jgi:hypothetical protein